MYLTTENAHKFLGLTLDAKRRVGHYYPLIVGKYPDERYYVRDRVGVCMPVPPKNDKFNTYYFDIVDGMEFEKCKNHENNKKIYKKNSL